MTKWILYAWCETDDASALEEQTKAVLSDLARNGILDPKPDDDETVKVFVDVGVDPSSALQERPSGRELLLLCATERRPTTDPGVVLIGNPTPNAPVSVRMKRRLADFGWRVRRVPGWVGVGPAPYPDLPYAWRDTALSIGR